MKVLYEPVGNYGYQLMSAVGVFSLITKQAPTKKGGIECRLS